MTPFHSKLTITISDSPFSSSSEVCLALSTHLHLSFSLFSDHLDHHGYGGFVAFLRERYEEKIEDFNCLSQRDDVSCLSRFFESLILERSCELFACLFGDLTLKAFSPLFALPLPLHLVFHSTLFSSVESFTTTHFMWYLTHWLNHCLVRQGVDVFDS